MGRFRVPNLELDGLAYTRVSSDSQRSHLGICTENVANQKIATFKLVDVFGGGQPEKEVIPDGVSLIGRDRHEGRLEGLVSGDVTDLENEIVFCFRNWRRVADRPASLTDERAKLQRGLEANQ